MNYIKKFMTYIYLLLNDFKIKIFPFKADNQHIKDTE